MDDQEENLTPIREYPDTMNTTFDKDGFDGYAYKSIL